MAQEFTPVGYYSDFKDGKPHKVEVNGEEILIAIVENQVFAVSDTCTHGEVSLSEGDLIDGEIECFLHGSSFNLKTGIPTCPPAAIPLATYTVSLEGDSDNPQVLISNLPKEK